MARVMFAKRQLFDAFLAYNTINVVQVVGRRKNQLAHFA